MKQRGKNNWSPIPIGQYCHIPLLVPIVERPIKKPFIMLAAVPNKVLPPFQIYDLLINGKNNS